MSVTRKFLLGLGGAAVMATGIAGSANAQVTATVPNACASYAQEYAAVNAPQFGGYDTAYRLAYNECITGGPDFVEANPYAYHPGPFGLVGGAVAGGAHVAGSALHAGATVAGSALSAGANVAGTALSIPGAILGGTASALAPAAPAPAEPTIDYTKPPVETKNYRGTYEEAPATAVVAADTPASSAALAADVAPEPYTPEWYAYCESKYNSFNPETGMYLAYSGTYRMCN